MKAKTKKLSGLSLIEIIIVVGIIALFVVLLVRIVPAIDRQSKEKATKATFALLEGALEEYKDFRGYFPEANDIDPVNNSEIFYANLYSIPSARSILKRIDDSLIADKDGDSESEIYDPWGTVLNYKYTKNGNYPRIISAGPDKKFATPDDIDNK